LDGMQLCVSTSLQTAAFAREALAAHPHLGERVAIVPSAGPTVAFRLFPPGETAHEHHEQSEEALRALQAVVDSAPGASQQELEVLAQGDRAVQQTCHRAAVSSGYHKSVYEYRERQKPSGRVLRTAWVGQLMHSGFTTPGHLRLDFPGEKAVFFNPATSHALIEQWIAALAVADRAAYEAWRC
jgi:hypothetical protein